MASHQESSDTLHLAFVRTRARMSIVPYRAPRGERPAGRVDDILAYLFYTALRAEDPPRTAEAERSLGSVVVNLAKEALDKGVAQEEIQASLYDAQVDK